MNFTLRAFRKIRENKKKTKEHTTNIFSYIIISFFVFIKAQSVKSNNKIY